MKKQLKNLQSPPLAKVIPLWQTALAVGRPDEAA
jgi:hypothetical protein